MTMGKEDEKLVASSDHVHLFESKSFKGRIPFRLFAVSILVAICFIFVDRVSHIILAGKQEAAATRRWSWIGLLVAEIWFTLYWLVTLVVRWKPTYTNTFKDNLALKYEDKMLPGIDIFVCTADPVMEPPIMVLNTVLSVMAYDYPPDKLSVYVSDDGGSDFTFYAMLEASRFAKKWLPFCKRFKVEPTSPQAYFQLPPPPPLDQPLDIPVDNHDDYSLNLNHWSSLKKDYDDMKARIEMSREVGRVPQEIRKQHKGFREWDFVSSRHHHPTILQILIDGTGRDSQAVDVEGHPLPTLVYLAREKRPRYNHHFKAGAMNALIRLSSRISNGPIILNVDCDMYSNNSESVRDALCFFMDEDKGHDIAFVQFPQAFDNLTTNDLYSSSLGVIMELDLHGFNGNGGPCYIGTGCFHRREALCGNKYNKASNQHWINCNNLHHTNTNIQVTTSDILEVTCKVVASATYEDNTQWGNEMGLLYGCAVEDIITGLAIQCKGWKSVYFNPQRRKGFLGVGPTTLLQSLVQQKRWSEGDLQIFLSRFCPIIHGHKRIPLLLQLSYGIYLLWAPNCFASLYYVAVPSLCLLRGISLFPQISNPWVLPYLYVFFANSAYSLGEYMWCGGTFLGWWNDQRMWTFKRTTSYLFGFIDTIIKVFGFTKSAFVITAKVADDDVSQRYEQELMEFGATSPMFTILATLALLNLFCFVGGIRRLIVDHEVFIFNPFALQTTLCGLLVSMNLPVYQGLFLRKDKGSMPASVTYLSIMFALMASSIALP